MDLVSVSCDFSSVFLEQHAKAAAMLCYTAFQF